MNNEQKFIMDLGGISPAQKELLGMFDHLETPSLLSDFRQMMVWSFNSSQHLDEANKTAQWTLWNFIEILEKITKENPIHTLTKN